MLALCRSHDSSQSSSELSISIAFAITCSLQLIASTVSWSDLSLTGLIALAFAIHRRFVVVTCASSWHCCGLFCKLTVLSWSLLQAHGIATIAVAVHEIVTITKFFVLCQPEESSWTCSPHHSFLRDIYIPLGA